MRNFLIPLTSVKKAYQRKLEQEFDWSIPKWVQVLEDRFDFIKLKINKNKNLATTRDKDGVKIRYSLSDANELVN